MSFIKKGINRIKRQIHDRKAKSINHRFETRARKRLKNDNFSIICSNCAGGTICHRLGRPFLSPTVNLWFHQDDFLKFVLNLKYYLSLDLKFVPSEYDYPVAMLDDVTIHFNHSKTAEEAENDWNRRKTRVNYDNLYIIMYDRDDLTDDDFRKLETVKCKNKIVLSEHTGSQLDYVYHIDRNYDHPMGYQFMDKDSYGMRTYEKQWDYVAWLNQ